MQGPVWVSRNWGVSGPLPQELLLLVSSLPAATSRCQMHSKLFLLLPLLSPTAETTSRLSPSSAQWVWHLSSSRVDMTAPGQRASSTSWLEPQPAVRLRLSW